MGGRGSKSSRASGSAGGSSKVEEGVGGGPGGETTAQADAKLSDADRQARQLQSSGDKGVRLADDSVTRFEQDVASGRATRQGAKNAKEAVANVKWHAGASASVARASQGTPAAALASAASDRFTAAGNALTSRFNAANAKLKAKR